MLLVSGNTLSFDWMPLIATAGETMKSFLKSEYSF